MRRRRMLPKKPRHRARERKTPEEQPLPEPKSELPALAAEEPQQANRLEEELAQALKYALARRAPSTLAIYTHHVLKFKDWCDERGLETMPASPKTVAAHLASEAERGVKPATLNVRLAALDYAHGCMNHPRPGETQAVKATLQGIRRAKGTAPHRKAPATADLVKEMVKHCGTSPRGLRDRAILLVGFAGAFRRSELANMQVRDLQFVPEGLRIQLPRSKSDQEGIGAMVAIPHGKVACPVKALKQWLLAMGIQDGYVLRRVFRGGSVPELIKTKDAETGEPMEVPNRLTSHAIGVIVKSYAVLIGQGDPANWGAHSLRSGMISSAVRQGVNVLQLKEHTRHKNIQVLSTYVGPCTILGSWSPAVRP